MLSSHDSMPFTWYNNLCKLHFDEHFFEKLQSHGVKVILYFLYSPVFQTHILYFRGKEKIPVFCMNSPVFPIF